MRDENSAPIYYNHYLDKKKLDLKKIPLSQIFSRHHILNPVAWNTSQITRLVQDGWKRRRAGQGPIYHPREKVSKKILIFRCLTFGDLLLSFRSSSIIITYIYLIFWKIYTRKGPLSMGF